MILVIFANYDRLGDEEWWGLLGILKTAKRIGSQGLEPLYTDFDPVIPGVCQDFECSAVSGGKDFWWTPLSRLFMLDFEPLPHI